MVLHLIPNLDIGFLIFFFPLPNLQVLKGWTIRDQCSMLHRTLNAYNPIHQRLEITRIEIRTGLCQVALFLGLSNISSAKYLRIYSNSAISASAISSKSLPPTLAFLLEEPPVSPSPSPSTSRLRPNTEKSLYCPPLNIPSKPRLLR